MKTEVEDLGPLRGIENIISKFDDEKLDSDLIIETEKAMINEGIPLKGTMGMRDNIGSIINWFRGREFVRDLAEQDVEVPWFSLHVPHDGNAQVSFEETRNKEHSVGLKIFGADLSYGRNLKVKISEESDVRNLCATYFTVLRVLPKVYAIQGKESIVIKILGELGQKTVEHDNCPFCNIAPDSIDKFENLMEPFIDIRKDSVSRHRKIKLDWSEKQSFKVGFKVPTLEFPLELMATAESESSWQVKYELKPGFFYQPYRELTEQKYQPPKWAFTK